MLMVLLLFFELETVPFGFFRLHPLDLRFHFVCLLLLEQEKLALFLLLLDLLLLDELLDFDGVLHQAAVLLDHGRRRLRCRTRGL